jgi:hypothetical protein
MKLRYVLVALALACNGDTDKTGVTAETGTTDTGGTDNTGTDDCPDGVYTGPITIVAANVTCAGDQATFAADTTGVTGGGWFYAQETGNVEPQYSENHTLDSTGADPLCNAYDHVERTITSGAAAQEVDVSSIFSCTDHYENNTVMTFAFTVNDAAGNQADCYAFGHDVPGMTTAAYDIAGEDPIADIAGCTEGSEGM